MHSQLAITGGNGKVGVHVLHLATSSTYNLSVRCIDIKEPSEELPPNASFVKADLKDYNEAVEAMRGCDQLVHLAAIPSPRGNEDWVVHNNNVVVSYNVLRAAAELGIKRITLASSVNAVGGVWSRKPVFDYLPLDEKLLCHAEDPYSLSKWIAETQAASISRRYGTRIASLRLHHCVDEPSKNRNSRWAANDLWGYVLNKSVADACLLGLTSEGWEGHEVFYIVSPKQSGIKDSEELRKDYWSDVPVREGFRFSGRAAFYDCSKAMKLLGWTHEDVEVF